MDKLKPIFSICIVFIITFIGFISFNAGKKTGDSNRQTSESKLVSVTRERDTLKANRVIENVNSVEQQSKKTAPSNNQTINTDKWSATMDTFVKLMYANKDSNLMHRYNDMKQYLAGSALNQLKPKSSKPNTDDGQNSSTVSTIKSYFHITSPTTLDVITEYTLVSNVGETKIQSPMVLKVKMAEENGVYKINNFVTNTSFAVNNSDRR